MQINILERKFYLFKQTHNFKKSYAIKLDKFDILSFSLQILGKNRSNEVPSIIKKISKEMCSKFYDSDDYISIESPSVPHPSQFNTSVPPLFSPQNLSVPHEKPSVQHISQFHTKKTLSSTPKTPRFNTKNPTVPHTPQFHPLSSTHPSDKNQLYISGVELRFFGVELRDFGC